MISLCMNIKSFYRNNDNKPILPPAMSILYAPENPILRQLMDTVQPIIFPVKISGVNSTYDLESSLIQESAFAGIQFPESFWVSLILITFKKQ